MERDKTAAGVQVLVRVRPFNAREGDASHGKSIVQMTDTATTILDPNNDYKVRDSFGYDKCFWSLPSESNNAPGKPAPFSSQDAIYNYIGPRVVESMWQGYNTCLFAYGQTGSGKTYTMMGDIQCPMKRGVIPRFCYEMFYRIKNEQAEQSTLSFKVDASYHEIYNEKVKDLLSRTGAQLKVRQHPQQGPYVDGLSSHQVNDVAGIYSLIKKGDQERSTAKTNLNDTSSRSHAIFTLTVTRLEMIGEMIDDTIQTKSRACKVNLVDLAGSERVSMSGVQGDRFEEAKKINLSLTTLGRVIDCLVERRDKNKNMLPPYRESALTWLLSDSLGGNSKTFMVATISPSAVNYNETISTLRYSSKARSIINVATVNKEEQSGKLTLELRAKIHGLQTKLRNFEKQESRNIETLEERCFQAEMEAEALRTRVAALEAKLGKGKSKEEDDRSARLLKEERSKCRRLEKQIKRLEQQVEVEQHNFVQETQELEQQLKSEQTRIGELQEEIESKEGEVKRLFEDQDRVVSERDLLFEQLQRLRAERKQDSEGKTSAKEKSHRINVLRKIARDQEEEKERVDKENKDLTVQITELQEQVKTDSEKYKTEIETMRESQKNTASSEAAVKKVKHDLEAANNSLKEQLERYKKQLSEKDKQLKISSTRVQNVMLELTSHAKEVTALREEQAKRDDKGDRERREASDLQATQAEQILQKNNENETLRKKLEGAENSAKQSTMIEKAHRDMVVEHNKTVGKLVELQKTVTTLKEELEAKDRLIKMEADKVELGNKEIEVTAAELLFKESEAKRLKQHIENLERELGEASSSHKEDRAAIHEEIEQEKHVNNVMKQQMSILGEERLTLRERVVVLQEKHQEADQQLARMVSQQAKTSKQAAADQELIANLTSKVTEKEGQYRASVAEVKKLKEDLNAKCNNPIENELVVLNRLLREKVQEQSSTIEELERELTARGLDKINKMFNENANEMDIITQSQCDKATNLKVRSMNSFKRQMITNIEEEEATIKKVCRNSATHTITGPRGCNAPPKRRHH